MAKFKTKKVNVWVIIGPGHKNKDSLAVFEAIIEKRPNAWIIRETDNPDWADREGDKVEKIEGLWVLFL